MGIFGLQPGGLPSIAYLLHTPGAIQNLPEDPAVINLCTFLGYVPIVGDVIGGIQFTVFLADKIRNGGSAKEDTLTALGFVPGVGDVIGGVQLTQMILDTVKSVRDDGTLGTYNYGPYGERIDTRDGPPSTMGADPTCAVAVFNEKMSFYNRLIGRPYLTGPPDNLMVYFPNFFFYAGGGKIYVGGRLGGQFDPKTATIIIPTEPPPKDGQKCTAGSCPKDQYGNTVLFCDTGNPKNLYCKDQPGLCNASFTCKIIPTNPPPPPIPGSEFDLWQYFAATDCTIPPPAQHIRDFWKNLKPPLADPPYPPVYQMSPLTVEQQRQLAAFRACIGFGGCSQLKKN